MRVGLNIALNENKETYIQDRSIACLKQQNFLNDVCNINLFSTVSAVVCNHLMTSDDLNESFTFSSNLRSHVNRIVLNFYDNNIKEYA